MHPFFSLREKLSPLRWDAALDRPTSQQQFLKGYLQLYQLEFPETLCKTHSMGTFTAANVTIVAHYWWPAVAQVRGTVFLLHGYYDHVGLLHHIIPFLLQEGYVVVAYDQPGHGLSSGEQACIHHFSEYVEVLRHCLHACEKNFPQPWFGMGQSTGGGVLLDALMQERIPNPFRGIVLLAPLVKPCGWNWGVWVYHVLKYIVRKIPRRFAHSSNDESFFHFCRDIDPLQSRYLSVIWTGAMKEWLDAFPQLTTISVRGLMIQGEDDGTVDWRFNLPLIKEKVKGLEYVLIPEARHHLVNERSDIRAQVFARIKQFLLAST